ncbi:ATP-binding cassette domain-containing protein [Streptococcus saliviloxodontae]|uniref:ATP-binding cassette subfamily B protein n=1 Tax=Streptococcus saliviloxodontae TaxID=1349416 RepID=A0ABS2PIG0_9STRE|nr:ABC transporter ATP-binding protein [Streptococcus saliviloxodontae]MBM7635213.1 ATP-binding cassette subfamily B protein [Streptococcus saliviloxodontae]
MKKYIFQFKYKNLLHIILLALNSASIVGASVTLALMTNELANKNFNGFLMWLFIEISLYLLYMFFTYIIEIHQTKLIQIMSLSIRERYVSNITKATFSDFQSKDIGDHLSILNNDIKMIEDSGFESFYSLLTTIFTTLFSIIALLSYDYRIVALTLVLTLLLTYLPRPFAGKMEKLMGNFSTANENLISGLSDYLTGYKDLYYADSKFSLTKQIKTIIQTFISQKIEFTKKTTLIKIIMALFSIVGQMSILLLTGFLIAAGEISLGTISSVGQISGNIFNSLTTFNQLRVAISSVKPLFNKFETEFLPDGVNFLEEIHAIDIQDLNYAFGDHKVFNDLNLTFEKGKKYAIVGESGSGKSTLINILLGNNKGYSGLIKYNTSELKDINESSLISKISYIGNHTHIFNDTLRNNLRLWDTNITNQSIENILEKVNLSELLSRLDDIVSPDLLSEGQKQRIGIARALLKNRNFIMMDEATANLDKDNSALIENFLLDTPEITYVTITHHLNSESTNKFNNIIQLKT